MAPQLVAARTVLAGVTGGIVSEVSGGSFANGAYTAAFQHLFNAEMSEKMVNAFKKIHQSCTSNKCITKMRDAYRKFYGDNSISAGKNGTYNELMADMRGKVYLSEHKDYTFNGSKWTELQNATHLTDSVGWEIKGSGVGVYALGVANGVHTMTVAYDGKTYSLMDQNTGWAGSFNTPQAFDAHMVKTTQDMMAFGKPNWSSFLRVNKLVAR